MVSITLCLFHWPELSHRTNLRAREARKVVCVCLGRSNDIDKHLASLHPGNIISVNFLENPMDLLPLLPLFIYEEPEVQEGYLTYSGKWWSQDPRLGMCDSQIRTHVLYPHLTSVSHYGWLFNLSSLLDFKSQKQRQICISALCLA